MSKLILGVGFNSGGKYKTRVDGKVAKARTAWYNMLSRAYCPKYHAVNPTYIGCSVADEWHDFQDFAEWFENHEYSNHGYQLDKDLLIPNNKVYAPDLCVFVPRQLNTLLLACGAAKGDLPQGVSFDKQGNKFRAQIYIDGKKKNLGRFDTEQEAYNAYKAAKEANVKRMANHWQDRIASDVFNALMLWSLDSK